MTYADKQGTAERNITTLRRRVDMKTKTWKSVISAVGLLSLFAISGAAYAGDWGQTERILTLTADTEAAYFSVPSYTACGNAEGWAREAKVRTKRVRLD
jgi:hypothetical protein